MRRTSLAWILVATAILPAGCGDGADRKAGTDAGSPPGASASSAGASASSARTGPVGPDTWGDPAPAAAGGKVGPGSGCPVALRFDIPAKWRAQDATAAGESIGGLTLSCEIDGKPAGVLGLMRVWASGPGSAADLAGTATEFVRGWASGAAELQQRDVKVGTLTGREVRYRSDGHLNRAYLVRPGTVTFVVHWGGIDDEEHTSGLPAYLLARTTAAAT